VGMIGQSELQNYIWKHVVEEDEMGGACSTNGGEYERI
jgi:hypothetical protein